ncbi:MAG: Lon protease family protein [Planctomycetota bacterium]
MESLPVSALRWRCDPNQFDFETTAQLAGLVGVLGQERAVESIRFGVAIRRNGYNIFASGPQGTGKQTVVERCVGERASQEKTPSDWCYVNNFDDLRRPLAISLPPGSGLRFRDDVDELIEDLTNAIPAALESEEHRARLAEMEREEDAQQDAQFQQLSDKAESLHVQMLRTPGGFVLVPAPEGKVLEPPEYDQLPREQRKQIEETVETLQKELQGLVEQLPWKQKLFRDRVKTLRREVLQRAIGHLLSQIKEKYRDVVPVLNYLQAMEKDILERVNEFQQIEESPELQQDAKSALALVLSEYQVNLLVDNSVVHGAPIVYEDHPSYHNLIGRVEHESEMGALTTDFSLIKAGALHRANGGYLILDANQLLSQPFAWEGLKRSLSARSIRMESLGDMMSLISTISLEPEPIPLDVKVILLGDRFVYYLLFEADDDFPELFKVFADFDDDLIRSSENCGLYARFLASLCQQENLLPMTRDAVCRVLEHAVRLSDHTERFSMHLSSLTDVVREAEFVARSSEKAVVDGADVDRAIEQQRQRSDRVRARIHEEIHRGTILIETTGARTGQVNGLSVVQLADAKFGQPSRITASVRLGRGDVINIEREVRLSGPGHSKGVMILTAFLGHRFAQDQPLSLTASLVFEQSYGLIDGDSASIAETCALLSVLSGVPIRQGIAVTGSMDQRGQAQPIGGVNEKIEGFFQVCVDRGLTGEQGVLIPESNRHHLMLRPDVLHAVESGQFFIRTFSTIDQAVEALTGVCAGEVSVTGVWSADSINGKVAARLKELTDLRRKLKLEGSMQMS